jgi:D-glycero-D-manno-heptose 1,7-bisphosphate phosphatase
VRLSHPGVAFLDRDGTINVKAPEGSYIERPEDVVLLPGAAHAIRALNDAHVHVVVVTNQRGIALGRMSEDDVAAVHRQLAHLLRVETEGHIDAIYHCPHAEGACDCRKPATGLLLRAREQWPWIDYPLSVMIGDSNSDVEAGRALGMRTLQIGVDVQDLLDAVSQLASTED